MAGARAITAPSRPAFRAFNAELSKPLEYDVEKAKSLIAESGVATPIKAALTIQEGDAAQQQLATVVQSTWSQIGIDLTIRVAPAAEFQDLDAGPQDSRLHAPRRAGRVRYRLLLGL